MKHLSTFFHIFTEYTDNHNGTALILSFLAAIAVVGSINRVAIRPKRLNRCNLSPAILFHIGSKFILILRPTLNDRSFGNARL
jgi:hypothetical protein